MKQKAIIMLSWLLLFSSLMLGQSFEEQIAAIEKTNTPLDKVKLLNELADTLLWKGDGVPYDAKKYVTQALSICEKEDCGEAYIFAKVLETTIQVNNGDYSNIYSFALPTLQNYNFKNPIIKAYLHETCCLYYFFQGQLDSVKYHIFASRKILNPIAPQDKRMGSAYEYIGFYYSFESIHDTSLIYMNKAADVYLENSDTLAYIKVLKFISSFYNVMGDTESSLEYLLKAKNIIKIYPDGNYLIHRINEGIGNVHMALQQHKDAQKAYNDAIRDLKKDKSLTDEKKSILMWANVTGLANALIRDNQADSALTYVLDAEALCQKYNLATIQRVSTKLIECEARIALKQYERSSRLLEEVFDISENSGSIEAYNIKIAKLFSDIMFQSNYTPSPNLRKNLMPILDRIINKNEDAINKEVYEAHKLRALLHIYNQNTSSAIADYQTTLMMQDTIFNQEKAKATNELLISYETKEKDQLIQIQELQIAKNQWQRGAFIGVIIGLLLILGIILVNYYQKQRYAKLLETAVKERTLELTEANKNLKQANYELRTFNYIASHDIKEPIRNIGNYAGLIERKLSDEDKSKLGSYFKTIKRSTAQLYTLIEDFSRYTMLSKDADLVLQEVDLNEIVSSLDDSLHDMLEKKQGRIINLGLPLIHSSSSLLYAALKNLVENGLKYNTSPVPTVEVSYQETDAHHLIRVSDNGIGIESVYHEQIFEMFKRLHHRGSYEGSGIGLAIVKLVIEKLNGFVELKSEKNQGSTFIIHLPKDE